MILRDKPNTETSTDPRAAELTALAKSEGIRLPLPVDLILWFEDRGCVVDLQTGQTSRPSAVTPTPSGRAVAYLLTAGNDAPPALATALDPDVEAVIDEVFGKPSLGVEDSAGIFDTFDYEGELEDLIEGRLDDEYHASGNW